MSRATRSLALTLVVIGALGVLGCAAVELLAYTGGGLPPGEPDLGGVVLAQAPDEGAASVSSAQAPPAGTVPVVGAQVVLTRGGNVVGRATTGAGGYFRFESPDTGSYRVRVMPPGGSGLREAERAVAHQRGQRTFITIVLERANAPGPGPGAAN